MQTPHTTHTTDPHARLDDDYFVEIWDNSQYNKGDGGSLRLQVLELIQSLTFASSEIAEMLTESVFLDSLPYLHRWSLNGPEASIFVRKKARETAFNFVVKKSHQVDGNFSYWARIIDEAQLTDREIRVLLLYTVDFRHDTEITRPLTTEEIVEVLRDEEPELAKPELEALIPRIAAKIRNASLTVLSGGKP